MKTEITAWMANYSARYILEDLNNVAGMEKMADLTGMPLGVIVAAFRNIFGYDLEKAIEGLPEVDKNKTPPERIRSRLNLQY